MMKLCLVAILLVAGTALTMKSVTFRITISTRDTAIACLTALMKTNGACRSAAKSLAVTPRTVCCTKKRTVTVSAVVGALVGWHVGCEDGCPLGADVGHDGWLDGCEVGGSDGSAEGFAEG